MESEFMEISEEIDQVLNGKTKILEVRKSD